MTIYYITLHIGGRGRVHQANNASDVNHMHAAFEFENKQLIGTLTTTFAPNIWL
jgi:hypothetical protein